MKNLLLICLIFSAVANVTEAREQKAYPIDVKLEKCMEKDFSTAGMNQCTYEATSAWKAEIAKYTALIKKTLDSKQLVYFNNANNAWSEFYAAEKASITNTIHQKDGTIHTTISAGLINSLARERALYLKGFYNSYKD